MNATASCSSPVRLRLSRLKGFDLHAHSRATNGRPAIDVARPGPFGNCFVVRRDGTAEECVAAHCSLLEGRLSHSPFVAAADQHATRSHVQVAVEADTYRGFNVACWCKLGEPCHGDTLLNRFNAQQTKP